MYQSNSYFARLFVFLMANRFGVFVMMQGQGQSSRSGGQPSAGGELKEFISSLGEEEREQLSMELARREEMIQKTNQKHYELLLQAQAAERAHRT